MSVLSILNRLKIEANVLVPLLFAFGLLLKTAYTTSDHNENDITVEKLPFCDEQLIHDRGNSKR